MILLLTSKGFIKDLLLITEMYTQTETKQILTMNLLRLLLILSLFLDKKDTFTVDK